MTKYEVIARIVPQYLEDGPGMVRGCPSWYGLGKGCQTPCAYRYKHICTLCWMAKASWWQVLTVLWFERVVHRMPRYIRRRW